MSALSSAAIGQPGVPQDPGYTALPQLDLIAVGDFPADCELAVGTSYIVAVTNNEVAWFDKAIPPTTTVRQSIKGTSGFFGSVMPPTHTGDLFDPVCHWDEYAQRFWVVAIEQELVGAIGKNHIYIAVTKTSNPNNGWNFYKILCDRPSLNPEDPITEADFEKIAVDETNLYISWPDFESFEYNTVDVIRKSEMLSNLPIAVHEKPVINPMGFSGDFGKMSPFWRPVQAYGTPPTRQLFVDTGALGGPWLKFRLHAIKDLAELPTVPWFTSVDVFLPDGAEYTEPPGTVPYATSKSVNYVDDSRMMVAVYHDGYMWAAMSANTQHLGQNRASVRWYKVALNGWPAPNSFPSVVEWGIVDDLLIDESTFQPSLAVSPLGHAAITYHRCRPDPSNEFPSIWRVARCATGTFGVQHLVKYSPGPIPNGNNDRNGDYTDCHFDPSRPTRFYSHADWQDVASGSTPAMWRSWIARYSLSCETDWDQNGAVNSGDDIAIMNMLTAQDEWLDLNDDQAVLPEDAAQAILNNQP